MSPVSRLADRARTDAHRVKEFALDAVGGPARGRVVLVLAAVLGLSGADTGTISSLTGNLERTFHVGNTQIGILLSVVGLVGAAFTIPAGVLTDRVRRTSLLAASIVFWAAAILLSGAAQSYLWLLLSRVALGAVNATAGPAVASLTGDFFPAADRGRMYGLIIGGDLLGSGIGYVISGDISSLTSWRYAIWWLAIPSLALAWVVWRKLPEPARGGFSHLPEGAEHIPDEHEVEAQADSETGGPQQAGQTAPDREGLAERAIKRTEIEPDPDLVLHSDPTNRSWWWAVRYVLRVRTNVVIIVASSLGYFFFDGLRSFAIIFATGHYGIGKPMATFFIVIIGGGALAGIYVGGRLADRLLRRGHIRGRIIVPVVCLFALTPALAPGFAATSIAVALPLLVVGGFLLGSPLPPLDAARLDIIHPRLWGRAEGVRTVLRSILQAAAPTAFGYVSQYVFGGPGSSATNGSSGSSANAANATALEYTFLVFLIPLIIAAFLALFALRTYPRDVATAAASVRAVNEAAEQDGPGEASSAEAGPDPASGDRRRAEAAGSGGANGQRDGARHGDTAGERGRNRRRR
jgi:MFS family permease